MDARRTGVLVTAALLVLSAPLAAAHRDFVVAERVDVVPANGALDMPVSIHYHRIAARVTAITPPDAPLRVLLVAPDGGTTALAGPGSDLVVNHVVRCCDDAAYTPFTLRFVNAGATDTHARLDAWALHDGFAVSVDNAESGAQSALVLIFGGAALWAFGLARRRAATDAPGAQKRALVAAALLAGLWATSAGLAAWGVGRFGGGPATGPLTATAGLTPLTNPIMTWSTWLTLAFMTAYIGALVVWGSAWHRRAPRDRATTAVAVALVASPVVAATIGYLEYGGALAPALLVVTLVPAPLWALVRARAAPDGPPEATQA